MVGYVYIVYPREFHRHGELIFKIGMTKQDGLKRFAGYAKDSDLLLHIKCNGDCRNIETKIIKTFTKKFKLRKDFGNEYFEGNVDDMMTTMFLIVSADNIDKVNEISEHTTIEEPVLENTPVIISDVISENTSDIISKNVPEICNDSDEVCNVDQLEHVDDDTYETESNTSEEDNIEFIHKPKPTYTVNTYEDWCKFNDTIGKVIIINKKTKEGFLKFKNESWRKLHNDKDLKFDPETMETLLDFIEHNQSSIIQTNNIESGEYEFISNRKFHTLNRGYQFNDIYTFEFIDTVYDIESIINDILNKCFVQNIKTKIDYNEYLIRGCGITRDVGYYVFNAITQTFTEFDTYIDNTKFINILNYNTKAMNPINIDNPYIVDTVLDSLIPNEIKHKYKKLTYNLIVEQKSENIFYDDSGYTLLTTWIHDLLNMLTNDDNSCLYSHYYYQNKCEYNKKFKTNKPRCVIISEMVGLPQIKTQLAHFRKLDIKNFIIHESKNMYNIEKFKKCLHSNEIIQYIENMNKHDINFNYKCEIQHDDNIFYKSNLLFTHFLMWCCSK